MLHSVDGEKIIKTLSDWGYNEGELGEIIVRLAEGGDKYISSAEAEVYEDHISYTLTLTEKGIRLYHAWGGIDLEGNIGNELTFTDEHSESVSNTLAEWGLKEYPKILLGHTEVAELLSELLPYEKWDRRKVQTYYKRGNLPEPNFYAGERPLWTHGQIEEYAEERKKEE